MAITDLASFFFHQLRTQQEEAGRIYEPVIGIVTDNKDPEKLARVKVKIPSLSDTDTTWWAPLISSGASKNRGWFFIPEIDDEVLVMFEHGDIGRPLIVGALWNGKDKPPSANSSGSNPKRLYKSRAGDLFELDDEGGKIIISDGGGKGRITIDKANKITIEALSGDVCLQAPSGDLMMVCKDATFEGTTDLVIASQQGVKLGSDDAVTIKAGGMMQASLKPLAVQGGQAQAPQAPEIPVQEIADAVDA